MKALVIGLLSLILILLHNQSVLAKKRIIRATRTGLSYGITIAPKLRSDRLALIINFAGLLRATSVSYTLSYNTNAIPQGVVGTIIPSQDTAQRELLFGTCSRNVCRYHTNLTSMRLVVTTTLKTGQKLVKSFRVKP